MKTGLFVSAIGSDFESLKAFNEEAFARFREDFASQLRKAKILLCDEFRHQHQEYLLADLQPDQHCVLFASAKGSWSKISRSTLIFF